MLSFIGRSLGLVPASPHRSSSESGSSGSPSRSLAGSPTDISTPVTTPYSPSPTDVGLVRGLLKSTNPALPTEIADIIINYADYSVRDVVTLDPSSAFSVSSRGAGVYGLVLRGPQIRELKQDGLELRDLKLESVRFEIASHDQGWGGELGTEGTYNSSFSWFEAKILRRLHHLSDKLEPPPDLGPMDKYATPAEYSDAYRPVGWNFVKDGNGRVLTWPVQKNSVATRDTQIREIVWTVDRKHQKEEVVEDSGSGSGEGFIRALQPGDVIFLWARAIYPGWANYVEGAMIEISYSG
ncbi:uncharacterized protein PADG_02829 [Paracoccidioides brasiliensis Pb18]|uniref:Uncharacterized protein n=1 Tax=Paracoccidioides brasiliensis (strain Pb18) TaxID=502780 RepID=C1G6M4_PARBD|nr:uncharacterized protein PADG_02829 [Paracoccidioides brasiliensis Pb18]EEH46731.2 hypothetical protein PADG_02829 [Paracoccidioides brasiliensis Pb18]